MLNQAQEETVLAKTRELCQAILDQPPVAEACQRLAVFMEDPQARSLYEGVVTRGQAMQEKQQAGQTLSPLEISEFEAQRDQLLAHPVARGFLDARELMHRLHHNINTHVSKTFELGRVPVAEDFATSCCGGHGDECCGGEGHSHDHGHEHGHGHSHGHSDGDGCGCKH
jgi:cell fate (sporulation/competence/biofilm development) regulator YlbF (YheA/YmcA/DUF963 family)